MITKGLLIKPIPYPEESAASFLLRAAQQNKHSSVYNMLGMENINFLAKQAPHCFLTELPRFRYALQVLDLDPAFESLALETTKPTNSSARKWGKLEVDYKLFKSHEYSYCPKCLAEKPFFKKLWLLKPIFACPTHSVYLLDSCYQCGKPIKLLSGKVSICSSCNFQLIDTPTVYCSSMSLIHWFLEILESDSDVFLHQFSSYWLAIDKFAKLERNLTTEEHLEITHEYLTDQQRSAKRLINWINQRIYLAHPRIQLLAFIKDRKSPFYCYKDYIKSIEGKCNEYIQSDESKNFNITYSQIRLLLNISRIRFITLLRGGFFNSSKVAGKSVSFSSIHIEKILISKSHEYWHEPITEQKTKPLLLGIKEVAERLNTNYETARKLVKTHWLEKVEPNKNEKLPKGTCPSKLEEFHKQFILASTLAKEFDVNPTNFVEKLLSLGIYPISGPHIDATPFNIYSRSSIQNLCKTDFDEVKAYQTRSGRHKNSKKTNNPKATSLTLKEVAKQLGISPNKVAILAQRGILAKDKTNQTHIIINEPSLLSLKKKLESKKFISIKDAAQQLNCTLNWLYEYWCKSGFLKIVELVYWRLIRRSQLDKVIKLKEEYLTGAEASKLLDMPHSHITNLQKQNLIQPVYLGTQNTVRLFRRVDVLKLAGL